MTSGFPSDVPRVAVKVTQCCFNLGLSKKVRVEKVFLAKLVLNSSTKLNQMLVCGTGDNLIEVCVHLNKRNVFSNVGKVLSSWFVIYICPEKNAQYNIRMGSLKTYQVKSNTVVGNKDREACWQHNVRVKL